MKTKLYLSLVLVAIFHFSCSNKDFGEYTDVIEKLEGEWEETPGIGYREVWTMDKNGLSGAGFMHAGNTFSQTETLAIVICDSKLVYQATVPNQNDGKTIPFHLSRHTDSTLMFTNPEHDFPNVIAYRFLSDTLLQINVQSLKDSSGNFSLRLKKNMDH